MVNREFLAIDQRMIPGWGLFYRDASMKADHRRNFQQIGNFFATAFSTKELTGCKGIRSTEEFRRRRRNATKPVTGMDSVDIDASRSCALRVAQVLGIGLRCGE
jgi:hypothetical protein